MKAIKIMGEEAATVNYSNSNKTHVGPITNEHWPIFVTLVSISAICLLGTVVLYLMIREKHNCRGWNQFSYLLALLLFFIVFIPALCPGLTKGTERNIICMTVSNQYFFVCSKMWLIIISVDMYCTIRKPKVIIVPRGTSKRLFPRFALYSVIGWIFPAIFVVTGIILNWKNRKKLIMKMSHGGLWTTVPDYGFLHCRIPEWIAWECFVFANCIFHFFMFGLISFTIFRQRARAKFIPTDNSRTTRKNQSSLALLVRLFIVVGLSWSYIAIQDLLQAGNINTKQSWIWHVLRSAFFLQGAFISAIIITNGHTWANLKIKYPQLNACFHYNFPKIRRNTLISIIKCGQISSEERKESIQTIDSRCTIETN